MLERPPLSLYIHIPWCIRKCPYCDFNSHESETTLPEAEYIDALLEDFSQERKRLNNDQSILSSIFIGGGTPSLFSGASYGRLLNGIREELDFAGDIEITLEANPGSAEADRFKDYRAAGINRLSLGIQSFDDDCLEQLGRIHNSEEALNAIALVKNAGFENFNLDLMHGLPGQTTAQASKDLQIAIDCEPTHISWYQLTIEPNTVFYRRPPSLPRENILENIQDSGQQLLAINAYQRYEVSAFALQGQESSHNKNYWSFGDYLGIGAGAHGKITLAEENKLLRTRKIKQPNHYLQAIDGRSAELKVIPQEELALEFLMNALRLSSGFSKSQYESRTGLPFGSIAKRVESQLDNGLLQMSEIENETFISATTLGYRYLNSVLEEFL